MAFEKGENLSNSTSSCEKVFTAVICCSCQTDQDASDHEHEHVPATNGPNARHPARDHAAKTSDVHAISQNAEIAEEKKHDLPPKEANEKGQTNTEQHEGKSSGLAKNDAFSDYIGRVKMKIRTMSNIGHGKNTSEADDVHVHVHIQDTKKENSPKDGFSDYINRAKMMIRKTSSVGSIKSHTFKRE